MNWEEKLFVCLHYILTFLASKLFLVLCVCAYLYIRADNGCVVEGSSLILSILYVYSGNKGGKSGHLCYLKYSLREVYKVGITLKKWVKLYGGDWKKTKKL